MQELKAILIKRNEDKKKLDIKEIVISGDHLKAYYKNLDCDLIDIQERYINRVCFDFILDDEGLLKNHNEPSDTIAIGTRKNEPLEIIKHALIICRQANEKGEEENIKNGDLEIIKSNVFLVEETRNNTIIEMLIYNFE